MQSSHAHIRRLAVYRFFLFTDTPTTAIYTLSLHDALPILLEHDAKIAVLDRFREAGEGFRCRVPIHVAERDDRSEEHTSELQSRRDFVFRLLLEKKKLVCLVVFLPCQLLLLSFATHWR